MGKNISKASKGDITQPSLGTPSASPRTSIYSTTCWKLVLKNGFIRKERQEKSTLNYNVCLSNSLEQRNKELQLEIKDLLSKLRQQRKWYSLVEIKMRNAERAREDAEKRNEMLQREMEEFFDTFGELTNEVKKTERIIQSF